MSDIKSISPCPIVDSIVEIRFSRKNIPSDAVFGIIYNKIKDKFSDVEKLPILDLPLHVRENDINLKYKPYYRLFNENIIFQCGADIISIGSRVPYIGWDNLSKTTFFIIKEIIETEIIDVVERIGFRYINFFEGINIDSFNVELKINNTEFLDESVAVRTSFNDGEYLKSLQITNNIKIKTGKDFGTVVDIDVSREDNLNVFNENYEDIINQCHKLEKKLFFDLLKDEFIKTFNIN